VAKGTSLSLHMHVGAKRVLTHSQSQQDVNSPLAQLLIGWVMIVQAIQHSGVTKQPNCKNVCEDECSFTHTRQTLWWCRCAYLVPRWLLRLPQLPQQSLHNPVATTAGRH
jgi:hypothetical protein